MIAPYLIIDQTGEPLGPPAGAIIVTGAAGGVGGATVAKLRGRGVNVLAVDVDDVALHAIDETTRGPGELALHRADVSDEAAVTSMVDSAVGRWGRLVGIFNNAGIEGEVGAVVVDYPVGIFDRVFSVNVRGVFLCMKYAIPALVSAGGGAVVNMSSGAALAGGARSSAYAASKHAVNGLTIAAALEYATQGVRVNSICPGILRTAMMERIEARMAPADPAALATTFDERVPVARRGEPGEVAEVAVWLLLDAPDYMTGARIQVDGGTSSA